MSKKGLFFSIVVIFLLLPAIHALGQPPPPPPQDIPLDGSLIYLLLGGITFFLSKFMRKK